MKPIALPKKRAAVIFEDRRTRYKAQVLSFIKRQLEAIESHEHVADIDAEVDELCVRLRDLKVPTLPINFEDLTPIERKYHQLEGRYLTEQLEAMR